MPAADWPAALADIDAAVGAAVAELDAYEGRWREAFRASGGRYTDVGGRTPSASEGVTEPEADSPWDDRLASVMELAGSAEADLARRADAVTRWRESLQRAQHLVEGEPCHGSR